MQDEPGGKVHMLGVDRQHGRRSETEQEEIRRYATLPPRKPKLHLTIVNRPYFRIWRW